MERNLSDALAYHAKSRPHQSALIDGSKEISYAQLNDLVNWASQNLLRQGCQSGQVVGLCLQDHWAHVVLMWSCMRAGLIMLPLDWRWTVSERDAVIAHFKAQWIIHEEDVQSDSVSNLSWQSLLNENTSTQIFDWPETSLESPLLLSLSSGTTGRPKGPLITHRHFLRRFWTHWINVGLNAKSRYVCATPLYFGGGRTFTLSVMFSGGTVILCPPPFDTDVLAHTVVKHRANALFLVPTHFRRLLNSSPEVRQSFQSLEVLISSGAPLQPNERDKILKELCVNFYEYYASTEGGGITLCTPEDFKHQLTSVGRPIFGVEVAIVDDDDKPIAKGNVGRLRYRGPGVADGFYNDPEQTSQHFKDGWFYPGDLGEIDSNGFVFLRGRSKDMIIRGGVNIYPDEIEATLMLLPDLSEVCVMGVPHPDLGESVACVWVGRNYLTADDLRLHCAKSLAPYKVPKVWLRVEELPRNSGGKVVKKLLEAKLIESQS